MITVPGNTLLSSGTAVGSKFTSTALTGNFYADVAVTINMTTAAIYVRDQVSKFKTLVYSGETKYVSMNLVQTAAVFTSTYTIFKSGETIVAYLGDLDNAGDNFPATIDPNSTRFGRGIFSNDTRPVIVTLIPREGIAHDEYTISVGGASPVLFTSTRMMAFGSAFGRRVSITVALSTPAAELMWSYVR